MNTPVKIAAARQLKAVADILTILAESGAASWALNPLELPDVVDPLQEFAQRAGLVSALGQNVVQSTIAAPFAKLREASR